MNNLSYKTKQRQIILDFMKENKDEHLTADDIMLHLIENKTPVGKATVYRTLDTLVNQGLVRKYDISGDSSCFQYVDEDNHCNHHYHLKCVSCNELFHIENKNLDKMAKSILKDNDFVIDTSKTVIYGTCKKCSKLNEKEKQNVK